VIRSIAVSLFIAYLTARRRTHYLEERPELVRSGPNTRPVRRLDEALAARKPVLRWAK
jgi:hypothetical protein